MNNKWSPETLRKAMQLYAVTDRMWLEGRTLPDVVTEALKGGITFLQLREKELSHSEFLREALVLKQLAKEYHVPFVINDNVAIAADADADGVHIGQSDMALVETRKRLGPDKIIGVSAQTVEQAIEAERNGADYLGIGALFATSTKEDALLVSAQTARKICAAVSIPVVGIGGLSQDNICNLKGLGLDGAAIVSAIFAAEDICTASQQLLHICQETFL